MFSAILILLVMPFTDLSRSRGIQFKPLSKAAFFIFVGNFLILMELGAKHVESPFIEFGQISTVVYFAHFLIIVPIISLLENTLIEMANKESIIIKQARSYKAIGATHLSSPTSFKPKHSHLKTFHKKKAQSRKTRGRCGHPYSPGR
jgi:ubiquinol-cytochrome c reductase cytochrome b subunit